MKKIKFWILISALFLLMIIDGLLTFINTPDLSMEANPLVTECGLGWASLIIANILVFIFIFIISYYSYFKYKTVYTNETKYTAYCSQIIYDRPDMFWKGIIPKHVVPYIAGLGFAILYSTIIAHVILIFEWLGITFNVSWVYTYFDFTEKYCFGRLDIIASVIVALIAFFFWFYKEFKKQLNK